MLCFLICHFSSGLLTNGAAATQISSDTLSPCLAFPCHSTIEPFAERSSQDLLRVRARLSRRFRTISEMLHERLFLLRSGFVSIPNPAASSDDAMSCRLQRVDQPR